MDVKCELYICNSKDFSCTSATPTGGDKFSNGEPQINLVHIFCGQITKKKESGFHCHQGGNDPDCAQASDVIKEQNNDLRFTTYSTIQVRDEANKRMVLDALRIGLQLYPYMMLLIQWKTLCHLCIPDNKTSRICIEDFSMKVNSDVIIEMKGCEVKTSYPMP